LRDIFDSTKKISEIRKKLYDTILFNKRFPKTLSHVYLKDFIDTGASSGPLIPAKLSKHQSSSPKKMSVIYESSSSHGSDSFNGSDSEDSKEKKKGIKFDLVKYFTDIGAAECLKKLQKEDLLDPELFFKVDWSTIESVALSELKPEGRKMKLTKKIKEMREKYEKDGFIEYLDHGLLEVSPDDQLPTAPVLMKMAKSTTMRPPKKALIRSSSSEKKGSQSPR
jgi:hypothetical protein